MKRCACSVVVFVVAITLLGGCAKDLRPKYARPNLAKGEYAAIEPTIGAFSGAKTEVDEVDGARIAGFMEAFDVRVSPGVHVIGLVVRKGGHAPAPQGALAHTMSTGRLKFRYSFEAGHVYEVGFNTRGDGRPILRDKTLRKMFYIDEPPLAVAPASP